MARIRVSVLGPVQVEVDGRVTKLSPRALRVLMRLVAAEGRPVGVRQLRWDLWQEDDLPHEARNGRNQVQKGVSELRKVLDPGRSGGADGILRTERLLNGRESESAYRLVLDAELRSQSRCSSDHHGCFPESNRPLPDRFPCCRRPGQPFSGCCPAWTAAGG
jgi:hypothetical protein